MIKYLDCNRGNYIKKLNLLMSKRPKSTKKTQKIVKNILKDIKKNGDKALLKYEKKFSQNLDIKNKKVITRRVSKSLDKKVKSAINLSYKRIFRFHSKQKVKNFTFKDSLKNNLKYKYLPIDSVGIYVPGGNAAYPSTVLMSAIPAKIAGVKRIVMVNPKINGKQNPAVLYAAKKCGINEIYSIGGVQSIGALTFGTKKIKKVDKIVGPGNIYVATAKKQVFGEVGVDMVAGPSEITIVADRHSNPEWIAADLIAQAEHDVNSQCILIAKDYNTIFKVRNSINKQIKSLPRKKIALTSLKKNGIFIKSNSEHKIAELINIIAPEHLELNLKNYNKIVNKIKNTGSICLGKYSAMAITDYSAGPNHILPTNSSSKFSSGLSVFDFYKRISIVNLSKKGIETIGEHAIKLANYEGLAGHAKSIEIRIRSK
tara:strand:+ start:2217 stop:3500 length:1284 start_codon:yes stop_codon:yes gene_type:complete